MSREDEEKERLRWEGFAEKEGFTERKFHTDGRTAADEVEPEEHRQREDEVERDASGRVGVTVGVLEPPGEVECSGDRVDEADDQLDDDKHDAARRHGDAPVVDAVVDHEHLHACIRIHYTYMSVRAYIYTVAPPRGGEGGSFPLWVDVQKLCNMCVLSLSWNFVVSYDKYIARPSSKEPR